MAFRAALFRVTMLVLSALAVAHPAQGGGALPGDDSLIEHAALPPPPGDLTPPALSEQRLDPVGSGPEAVPASPIEMTFGDARLVRPITGNEAATGTPVPSALDDYPVVSNDRIRHFLARFTGIRRRVIERWLDRSGRYLGMIQDTLRRHGLPEDLAFTAMIESGFNPVAVSRAGAKGLWQFMARTARDYGLRVDQWVDERLDPEKSTVAAAAYLRDLYNQFGSWFLAQAAYNAGEVKVARAIRLTRSTDFWEIARSRHLHDETKDFVPAIQAMTLIGRDPDLYGFDVAMGESPRFDTVRVPPATDLGRLSRQAGLSPERLQMLNPELWRHVTPPGGFYDLKVPEGATEGLRRAVLAGRAAAPRAASARGKGPRGERSSHVVRRGETVSAIARKYGVGVKDILRWNRLARQAKIHPGDRIQIVTNPPPARRDPDQGGFR